MPDEDEVGLDGARDCASSAGAFAPAGAAGAELAAAVVLRCGWVSVFQKRSSGASVCVTSSSGRDSNSRILFTSPGWMIFFQLFTNADRDSSSKIMDSAAATRRLTTSTLHTTSVFGCDALPSVCSLRYSRCLCLNSFRSSTAPHRHDSEGHTTRWCANQS